MNNDPNPVTYREMHEYCAGHGLENMFFLISGINPDAPVRCNCLWADGHQPECDIVLANKIMRERDSRGGRDA